MAQEGNSKKKPVRVWVDGCFDLMHFGHANAIRQAKAMGDILVVGCHSDADILKNKGPTLMREQERYDMLRACKWVDQVVEGSPYTTQLESLEDYNCDFVVHGDDITTDSDGQDAYHLVKSAGKYKECKRTQGVSTTDIVGRLLKATGDIAEDEIAPVSPYTGATQYIATSRKLMDFANGKVPQEGDVIGYIPGAFDLFHNGHVDILKAAKSQCDFLYVGLHSDKVVEAMFGEYFPIMNLQERALSALACRYTDEVVIGTPPIISEELLNHLKINKVFHIPYEALKLDGEDRLKMARARDMVVEIDTSKFMSTMDIVERVKANREAFVARNAKKAAKELGLLQQNKD